MTSKETVFISGASGFIALHIIDVLLTKNFKVIGSVRTTAKGDNLVKNFKSKHPNAELSYELVGDIANEGAFDEIFVKHPEIKYVLHTASPVTIGTGLSVEDAFLNPAIAGTVNMLKAINKFAPQVAKVVVTSSFAALAHMEPGYVHTEKSWNPITLEQARSSDFAGYMASKTFAEKAAWEFLKEHNPSFELTTINPPFVLGPQLFEDVLQNETLNFSAEIVNGMLKTTPKDDDADFSSDGVSVDVRDVGLLHVLPLLRDNLGGKRLFPVQGGYSGQLLLNLINENFPQLQGKIARGHPENAESYKANYAQYDNSETIKLTGVEFIPLETTVVDSVKQVLDYKNEHT